MTRSCFALICCTWLAACSSDTLQPVVGLTTAGDVKTSIDGQLGDSLSDIAAGADAAAPDTGPCSADVCGSAPDAAPDVPVATADAAIDAAADVTAKYGVCSNLFLCTEVACGTTMPKGCAQVCIDAAGPEAQAEYLPFSLCVETYCRQGLCNNSNDPNCMGTCSWQKCYGKLLPCGSDGKSGAATCDAMITCYDKCANAAPQCMFDCYATLSAAAQSDYQAMNDCFVAAGGTDPGKSCPDQLFKCIAGGKSGTKTCLDTLVCTDACNSLADSAKFGCIAACYEQATVADQKTFLAVSKCLNGTSTATCSDDIVTCTNPAGAKNCLDVISCVDPCKATGKSEGVCFFSCMNQATKPEAKKFVELLLCVGSQCGYCNKDKTCEDACTKSKCQAQLNGCLGQ